MIIALTPKNFDIGNQLPDFGGEATQKSGCDTTCYLAYFRKAGNCKTYCDTIEHLAEFKEGEIFLTPEIKINKKKLPK